MPAWVTSTAAWQRLLHKLEPGDEVLDFWADGFGWPRWPDEVNDDEAEVAPVEPENTAPVAPSAPLLALCDISQEE